MFRSNTCMAINTTYVHIDKLHKFFISAREMKVTDFLLIYYWKLHQQLVDTILFQSVVISSKMSKL